VRIISPTDCVKDRLTWYYHSNDTQCLQQAILVANAHAVDLAEIERWPKAAGKHAAFTHIKDRLTNVGTTKRRTGAADAAR
jgi:hypothetical protein